MKGTAVRLALRACAVISVLMLAAGSASAASAQTVTASQAGGGPLQYWFPMPIGAEGGILLAGVVGVAFAGSQWRRRRKLGK
jgi:hypothetical protein